MASIIINHLMFMLYLWTYQALKAVAQLHRRFNSAVHTLAFATSSLPFT